MASRTPPRFVPTLTEVVQTSGPAPLAPAAGPSAAAAAPSQEQIVRRVMQRVDLALERRLRETIASVVLEQTSAFVPVLRDRVEAMVREIVAEAVDEEMRGRER